MEEQYTISKARAQLTPGSMVRTIRKLQDLTQLELAKRAKIPQPDLSAIESDREALGVERAKKLARALKVHPAVLLFPDWEMEQPRKLKKTG